MMSFDKMTEPACTVDRSGAGTSRTLLRNVCSIDVRVYLAPTVKFSREVFLALHLSLSSPNGHCSC